MSEQPWHPQDLAAGNLPPFAPLVTDEDVEMALRAYDQGPLESLEDRMRLALEAYGRRLVARLGRAGQ